MIFPIVFALLAGPPIRKATTHQKPPAQGNVVKVVTAPVGPPPFDPTQPISIKAPKARFHTVFPLPGSPGIIVDRYLTGGGVANEIAHERHLQSRMIWIDGTANIEKINTEDKIVALVAQIKSVGFNTIVWDGKPISGQTLYPSSFAPHMDNWRTAQMPPGFDPLKILVREAKKDGLMLFVSLNAFSEGHQILKVGPGYARPDQQTVLYEPRVILKSPFGAVYPCSSEINALPNDASQIGIFTDQTKLPKFPIAGTFAVSLAPRSRVIDGFDTSSEGAGAPTIPKGGAVLVGRGGAGEFLKRNAIHNNILEYGAVPALVPISQRPTREIPLMMNPNDPKVQGYALEIVRELLTNYNLDGIVYDDRLRYAGIDGDFSEISRQAFEKFVGHTVDWPSSIYTWAISTNMQKGVVPGPEWDAWVAFRALTIRNYLARVRSVIKETRPLAQLGIYTGSDFGDYFINGTNWGSPQFSAGFWSLTPGYKATGYAPLTDFIITGAYYTTATVHEALSENGQIGESVEAAGATANGAVRDSAWTVAGISLIDFHNDPTGLVKALTAACATTQGVMVFDLSHDIEPMWPVFARAFSTWMEAPQGDPAALALVRQKRAALDALGIHDPIFIVVSGNQGAGL
jgi:hypothetical protein